MAQFALNTQNFGNTTVGNNFGGDRNQVNNRQNGNNNGFNSLLSGLMTPTERPQFQNPFADQSQQVRTQQQPNSFPNQNQSAEDVATQANTNDALDYNSPDSILSQNSRVQHTEVKEQNHHHQAEENKPAKEHIRDDDTNQQLADTNNQTGEKAQLDTAEYIVDSKDLKQLNKASTETDVVSSLLNGNVINPNAVSDIAEDLSSEVANSTADIAEMSTKIAELKSLNTTVPTEVLAKNLASQDDIDAMIAQNDSKQRAKNAVKIDAGKAELLKQLSPEIYELVKDKITVESSVTNEASNATLQKAMGQQQSGLSTLLNNANASGNKLSNDVLNTLLANGSLNLNAKKTASSLNSNNITNLKDLINTAKEAKAQTMLDSVDIMLNGGSNQDTAKTSGLNGLTSGLNGLTSGLMADLQLKTQQYLASKGQLNVEQMDLTSLNNLNVNLSSLQGNASTTNNLAMPTNVSTFTPNYALNTPFGNPLWGQALNEQMQYFLSKNLSEVQLSLNPQNLGPIDIKLNLNAQSQLAVQFMTANPEVQKALENNMSQLQTTLADKGIVLTSSTVQTVASTSDANLQQQSSDQSQAQADLNQQQQQSQYQASAGNSSNGNNQSSAFNQIAEEVGLNPTEKPKTVSVESTFGNQTPRVNTNNSELDLFA